MPQKLTFVAFCPEHFSVPPPPNSPPWRQKITPQNLGFIDPSPRRSKFYPLQGPPTKEETEYLEWKKNSRFQFSVIGTRYHLLSVILFGKVGILNDLTKGYHGIIGQTIIMFSQSLLLSLY